MGGISLHARPHAWRRSLVGPRRLRAHARRNFATQLTSAQHTRRQRRQVRNILNSRAWRAWRLLAVRSPAPRFGHFWTEARLELYEPGAVVAAEAGVRWVGGAAGGAA